MDNGLRGQYLEQLEGWNRARSMAVEVLEAYSSSDRSIKEVAQKWESAVIDHLNELKQKLSEVLFLDARNTVDELARVIYNAEGWWATPI